MGRHYRESTKKDDNENFDLNYSFYMDCFDRVHHQIHHITRLGLRLQIEQAKQEINKINITNANDTDIMINDNVNEMKKIILQRSNKYGLGKFKRFQNNKFNLTISESKISSEKTAKSATATTSDSDLIYVQLGEHLCVKSYQIGIVSISELPTTGDTLIDLMLKEKYEQFSNECHHLIEILKFEGYDTDSIIMDLDDLIIDNAQNNTTKKSYNVKSVSTS